jgi:hypothetical protein
VQHFASLKTLSTRAAMRGRRSLTRLAGVKSGQSFYLDSYMVVPRSSVERIALYADHCTVKFQLPANAWPTTFSYPRRYVYRIPQATIEPLSGLVYDCSGNYIAESSSQIPLRRFLSWPRASLRRPTSQTSGEFVFLPSNANYYHWLLEDLPVALSSLSMSPSAVLLIPETRPRYVQEFIDSCGREVHEISRPTTVENLIMTGKTGGFGSPFGGETPHPQDVATLREYFGIAGTVNQSERAIYLSRVGYQRSPVNEVEVEAIAKGLGYQIVHPHELGLRQQVKLFSTAAHVAGFHGAAFSNIVWTPDLASVREIFHVSYVDMAFACIAAIRTLDYDALLYDDVETTLSKNSLHAIHDYLRLGPP